MMSWSTEPRWDISVDDRNGQLALAVEVKRKTNASTEWASQLRSNILAHGTLPKAPYFLMAFPDRFYLWTQKDNELEKSEPTYQIDARNIVGPYLERAGIEAEEISSQSLEVIVLAWLYEIMEPAKAAEQAYNVPHWLVESGLYSALAGGEVEQEALV